MIPAVVLTGFLGAGKTTALNALIAAQPDLRVGVIENEAGETAVDTDLLHGAARVVEVAGGCACCTLRGQLTIALELLAERTAELDLLVVVDAAAVAAVDEPSAVWRRQLRFANFLLIGKLEHVAEHAHPALRRRIAEHAPAATILDALHDEHALTRLLTVRGAARAALELSGEPAELDHGFTAHALRVDADLDAHALDAWLGELLREPGVSRVKGSVAISGHRSRYIIQATPQLLETYVDSRPAPTRGSGRLVVIGADLDRAALQTGLDRCCALVGR